VDDALPVGGRQGVGHLDRAPERLVDRQRPASQPIGERLPLDVLHHEEGQAFLVANVVERADVRVIQSGDRLGFAVERARHGVFDVERPVSGTRRGGGP